MFYFHPDELILCVKTRFLGVSECEDDAFIVKAGSGLYLGELKCEGGAFIVKAGSVLYLGEFKHNEAAAADGVNSRPGMTLM